MSPNDVTSDSNYPVLDDTSGDVSMKIKRVESALRTRYWSWVYRDGSSAPTRLLQVLISELPHIDPSSWSERFDFGGIYINGHEALGDVTLNYPCKVEYYEPKFAIQDATALFSAVTAENIIFRDEDLAVVFKPSRLSSMPAKEQRHFSLKKSIEKLCGVTIHMPSRLDVSVSGLVVVSLSGRMHSLLQRAFETRQVSKVYNLESADYPAHSTWSATGRIGRDPRHPVLRKVVESEGQAAQTDFKLLNCRDTEHGSATSLIEARPVTGRTHQIRVHAAHSGVPIIGDNFYDGAASEELRLVSRYVTLVHPLTGKRLNCELPHQFLPPWLEPKV